MRVEFAPFLAIATVDETRQLPQALLINRRISAQIRRSLIADEEAIVSEISPPRLIVDDETFVVVAEFGGVVDVARGGGECWLDAEGLVHGAWEGNDGFARFEGLAGCGGDCDVMLQVFDGGDGVAEVDV